MFKKLFKKQKRIYLDFASQTMPSKKVLKEMKKVSSLNFNPANLYKEGVEAENILNEARNRVAKVLGVRDHEIYFTGSGTLSCAEAIFGVVNGFKNSTPSVSLHETASPREANLRKGHIEGSPSLGEGGASATEGVKKILPHIITSNIEHASVIENIKYLEEIGEIEATYIECDEFGIIDAKKVKDAIKENTILISIMYVNNEIGIIQDIKNISKKIKEYKKERYAKIEKSKNHFSFVNPASETQKNDFNFFQKSLEEFMSENNCPYFHTDAAQAPNYLSLYIDMLGVDMMSINGSKIYGPKSSGILFKKENVKIFPFYFGGGQERNIFSGTVDIEKAVGISIALEEAQNKIKDINSLEKISIKRNNLLKDILENIKEAKLIGYWNENEWKKEKIGVNREERIEKRLPNNISIWLSDFPSDEMVLRLDQRGFAISAGSACSAKSEEYSDVIFNISKNKYNEELSKKIARETIRITIDNSIKEKDLKNFVKVLREIYYKFKKK